MKKLVNYIRSSFDEVIHKVTWPKFGDLQNHTVLVLIASVIFSLVVFGIDKLFQLGVSVVYQQ